MVEKIINNKMSLLGDDKLHTTPMGAERIKQDIKKITKRREHNHVL